MKWKAFGITFQRCDPGSVKSWSQNSDPKPLAQKEACQCHPKNRCGWGVWTLACWVDDSQVMGGCVFYGGESVGVPRHRRGEWSRRSRARQLRAKKGDVVKFIFENKPEPLLDHLQLAQALQAWTPADGSLMSSSEHEKESPGQGGATLWDQYLPREDIEVLQEWGSKWALNAMGLEAVEVASKGGISVARTTELAHIVVYKETARSLWQQAESDAIEGVMAPTEDSDLPKRGRL